jgi:hypothetical protein
MNSIDLEQDLMVGGWGGGILYHWYIWGKAEDQIFNLEELHILQCPSLSMH